MGISINAQNNVKVKSRLEIYDLKADVRTVVYDTPDHIEAPNWTPDGKFLVFNSKGSIFKIPMKGGNPEKINTGMATNCNNDHVISADGKQLAISHNTKEKGSIIYILPFTGGEPRQVTPNGPSYLHGWSPDGKTLAYCAQRNGEYDVYTISEEGGEETRLTTTPGLDDGPEYSSDGKYIYFNSVRTGLMQCYRMKPDGSDQEQLTFDQYHNWFPHPSPNREWVVFLTYEKEVEGHPANKNVTLRLMPFNGGESKSIVKLFGGQGTINVHSWSPDSNKFAFVSYEILE
ncbi:MAG: TolB family protein [Bacteroidales bacterium]|nr:TolB family protein [Bacteroidales bacterium]